RTVAALRYAEELSPEAFAGYVEPQRNGTYALKRLPAEGDPMFDRTQRVRQRERLFVETLNQHYVGFSSKAEEPYHGWRQYAREEALAIRELTKSARWRTGLGIATIVASVVYGSNAGNDSFSERVVRDALMYMGVDVLRTSAVRRQEKKLHASALEELSTSFEDEIQPLVVEIKGTEHRLTGTAEAQYQEWRDLLRQLFVSETGFVPEDVHVYVEEPEPLEPGIERPAADAEPAEESSGASESAAGDAAAEPSSDAQAEAADDGGRGDDAEDGRKSDAAGAGVQIAADGADGASGAGRACSGRSAGRAGRLRSDARHPPPFGVDHRRLSRARIRPAGRDQARGGARARGLGRRGARRARAPRARGARAREHRASCAVCGAPRRGRARARVFAGRRPRSAGAGAAGQVDRRRARRRLRAPRRARRRLRARRSEGPQRAVRRGRHTEA